MPIARELGQRHFSIKECLKAVFLIPFFLIASASGLQGCASTEPQGLQRSGPPNDAITVSKNMVTIENLLRWPLEGPGGADKAIANLRQVFVLEKLQTPAFYGNGPINLADGHVLTFTFLTPDFKFMDIGVAQEPCFTAERAAAITGTTANPVTQDAHGIDQGKFYYARRNGMRLSFTTTPDTYKCIDSIHVRPIREIRK